MHKGLDYLVEFILSHVHSNASLVLEKKNVECLILIKSTCFIILIVSLLFDVTTIYIFY